MKMCTTAVVAALVVCAPASSPPSMPPPAAVALEIDWANGWTIVGLLLLITLALVGAWRVFRHCLELSLERRLVS